MARLRSPGLLAAQMAPPPPPPDEHEELPRTPERYGAGAEPVVAAAPLSPALEAARKLLEDLGVVEEGEEGAEESSGPSDEEWRAVQADIQNIRGLAKDLIEKPAEASPIGDAEELGTGWKELSAGLPMVVATDSPQKELATIRQQIKSMQAARRTRASLTDADARKVQSLLQLKPSQRRGAA